LLVLLFYLEELTCFIHFGLINQVVFNCRICPYTIQSILAIALRWRSTREPILPHTKQKRLFNSGKKKIKKINKNKKQKSKSFFIKKKISKIYGRSIERPKRKGKSNIGTRSLITGTAPLSLFAFEFLFSFPNKLKFQITN